MPDSTNETFPPGQLPAEAVEDCINPLTSAAASLLQLGIPERQLDVRAQARVAEALRYHVMQIGRDDFSGMELMLTCQAQILHRLFAQATEKYAAVPLPDAARPYATIALKAQSYCRMTVNALTQMKGRYKQKKSRNDVVSEPGFE